MNFRLSRLWKSPWVVLITLALIAVGVGGCPAPSADGGALPGSQGKAVRVAVIQDFAPFSQRNPQTDKLEGWDIDIITAIGDRLDFHPDFIEVPRETLIADVVTGSYDLAGGGVSFTLDRSATLDYAAPYFASYHRAVVRADETRASTVRELRLVHGIRVGALGGSTSEETARAFFGVDAVQSFSTADEIFAALLSEQIDVAVVEQLSVDVATAAHPGAMKQLPGAMRGDVLAFILPKGSDLTLAIQLAFDALQQDGTAQQIAVKWGIE